MGNYNNMILIFDKYFLHLTTVILNQAWVSCVKDASSSISLENKYIILYKSTVVNHLTTIIWGTSLQELQWLQY
jgi:hypothetical protein